MNKIIVLGASPKVWRYSNKAIKELRINKYSVVAVGFRRGVIGDVEILMGMPDIKGVDTLSLYIGPVRQKAFYNYILGLKPRQIIFNPGTENTELMEKAKEAGIKVVENCMLMMLKTGTYN
jgi:predicted CoA-binding protein